MKKINYETAVAQHEEGKWKGKKGKGDGLTINALYHQTQNYIHELIFFKSPFFFYKNKRSMAS